MYLREILLSVSIAAAILQKQSLRLTTLFPLLMEARMTRTTWLLHVLIAIEGKGLEALNLFQNLYQEKLKGLRSRKHKSKDIKKFYN